MNNRCQYVTMHVITLDVRTKMYKSPYELTNAIPLRRLSLVGVILTEIISLQILTLLNAELNTLRPHIQCNLLFIYNFATDGLPANPIYVSTEPRPNESASKKMETEKTATANEDGHIYSQVKKKDKKGTLYNSVFIQLILNQLRGDGQ